MYYMRLGFDNRPIGWRLEPAEGYIEVADSVYWVFSEHPDYVWNGVAAVPYVEPAPVPPALADLRETKLSDINSAFLADMAVGVVGVNTASSGGVQVDARRDATHNDLQNVEGLIDYMVVNNISVIMFKCADNKTYPFTLDEMRVAKISIIEAGILLYARKHSKEDLIEAAYQAGDREALNAVAW